MCIARLGIIAIGFLKSTNIFLGLKGLSPFTKTLPASDRGLSSQLYNMGPP